MAKEKKKTGLGGRIAAARKKAGLSQTELGKAFGLTRSSVSQWESEGTEPTPSNLRSIAVKCGVSYEWLATGTGTMLKTVETSNQAELIQLLKEIGPENHELVRIFLTSLKHASSSKTLPEHQDQNPSIPK